MLNAGLMFEILFWEVEEAYDIFEHARRVQQEDESVDVIIMDLYSLQFLSYWMTIVILVR